jgi:hypothetical protein
MNWPSAIMWGFAATVVLTTILASGRGLGLTRMDMPFMLGTMFTTNRNRAKVYGFLVHLLNGWIFAFIYVAAFEAAGVSNWLFGAAIGLVQASFVLTVGMDLLPTIHPRMASEQYGPDPTKQLQPPGFLAKNYGNRTPIATFIAHLVFGGILGFFYRI